MADNRITDLPKDIFTRAMPEAHIPKKQITAVMSTLSSTSKRFYGMFKEELTKRAMETLCQAVTDDNRDAVKKILGKWPNLLLVEPSKDLVIASQLTWQKFYAEKPAIMAAKRKQLEMLKLMLPYYNKLPQTEAARQAKAEAISAWSLYEIHQNAQGEDKIVIPEKYTTLAESLINVLSEEPCLNGITGKLSEKTELALSSLFEILLPKHPVKLNDYLDTELLLLTIYQAYWDRLNTFKKWDQKDAFCVRVIGLIQSVLIPEMAKIFCEGLDEAVIRISMYGEKLQINKEAMSHKLKSDESFYRSSRDSTEGLGANFFCGVLGQRGHLAAMGTFKLARTLDLEMLMLDKNNRVAKLMPHPKAQTNTYTNL